MRNYEAMYVLRPDMDEKQINAAVEKILQGSSPPMAGSDKVDHWGKDVWPLKFRNCVKVTMCFCYFYCRRRPSEKSLKEISKFLTKSLDSWLSGKVNKGIQVLIC